MTSQTDIINAVVITWVAGLLAQIGRVFARRLTKVQWWWDDYSCLGAFIFGIGYNAVMIHWTLAWYLGQTIPNTVSEEEYENINLNARLMQFLISHTYTYSIGLSKLSILLFYWRIFKQSAIRIPILILLTASAAWIILRTFMVTFRCVPVQAYWDKSINDAVCNINDAQFFFGTCLTHFFLDVFILALPVIEVFKLRLRLTQKIAITALFVVGFIVCLASVFVIVTSIQYDPKSTQMPLDVAPSDMWGAVEINIAIVSGCFPLLRPIFTKILPRKFLSSVGSSHPVSRTTHGATRLTAIRMATINRTNKEKEQDETSSTHQLADPEQGLPGDFELFEAKQDPHTFISSRTIDSRHSGEQDMARIYVRNDVVMEIEGLDDPYSRKR
ncbi:hypothetical protein IWW34DRAFT_810299 [Fusarium oxysporum f. sp. albedinis]|nr:hypothetical protein IWW34DRAFT_810299 [Fusarium oxysporum f. sp. albedinis]KAK2471375.1 hypothetical protein H9L39_17606 [Fusarium oxysporum f. sp. albedinis]